jgi:hypothetical protein
LDRQIIYVDQNPLDVDQLQQSKNTMIALGMALQAIVGTSTLFDGLACTPTGPASLQVLVGPGSVYALENVDSTAYGSLAADTTHQIVKQGINLGTLTLSCPAPGTTGQSINYLIEAAYQDTDTGATVLPYFDSTDPDVAYNGPNNTGVSQNTVREGQCIVNVKAGVAATTGSQTTPAPNAGFTGLWVVTVANGQTTITSGNIAQASGAPFIANKLTALAPLASPALTGVPTVPTASPGTNTTQAASTAFVQNAVGGGSRTILTGNKTYYVATTGNDANPGTSGSPWLTIQHAINVIANTIDLAGFTATINVGNGTYTGGVLINSPFTGGGSVLLNGNTGSPSSCIISTTSADAIAVTNATLHVQGFTVQTTTAGNGIKAGVNGAIYLDGAMNFGNCVNDHMNAIEAGSFIGINANYTISGNSTSGGHWVAQYAGAQISCIGQTITLTGTPSFGSAFAYCDGGYLIIPSNTFSGSATGPRYAASNNGVINTGGGGATYLPGSSSGTGTNSGTSPYGLYV